jgi:hypothetical protein
MNSPYKAGYLEIILGPMYASKTTRLVEIYNQCRFCDIPVVAINHNIDNRYDQQSSIVTHDKTKIPCIKTNSLKNIEGYDENDIQSLADKIFKAAYMTNGETAKNSPIVNRTYRFLAQNENGEKLIAVTGKEKRLLKENGKFRIAVRKDELSTFKDCQKIEKELVDEVTKVLLGSSSHTCFYCGGEFTVNDFIGKNRKDPNAAQHGHIEPLSDETVKHISGNVSWIHRECNLEKL